MMMCAYACFEGVHSQKQIALLFNSYVLVSHTIQLKTNNLIEQRSVLNKGLVVWVVNIFADLSSHNYNGCWGI